MSNALQNLFRRTSLTNDATSLFQDVPLRVGMFAVHNKGNKPGNSRRLIIVDCRQANSLMRHPPTTRLATPSGLTGLDFSLSTLEDNGFSFPDGQAVNPGIETGDVGDCFYNFSVPKACSWFSTGDVVTRADMRTWGIEETSIYNEDLDDWEPLGEDERVFICFEGMPMHGLVLGPLDGE